MPRGSKPGERRGGRCKGTLNRATKVRRDLAEKAVQTGLTPLEYMLDRLRDENEDPRVRQQMARDAAPYLHPRLSATEYTGVDKGAIKIDTTLTPSEAYFRLIRGGSGGNG